MRKLIIVCEEKCRQYGDFLSQMISNKDDKEGEIVGVKDGSVAAQVWTEKEYTSNAVQISSEQYILFIGNSKLMRDKRLHMQKKFEEHGMNYGWLGKQGVLFVEATSSFSGYDSFYETAKLLQPDLPRLLEYKEEELELVDESVAGDFEDTTGVKKFLNPVKKALPGILSSAKSKSVEVYDRVANYRKIEEQKYSYLTLCFYLNGLSDFLGLSEEG